jgi:hypothetical protein
MTDSDVAESVFKYLTEKLIEWKSKLTPYGQPGEGFSEDNVLDITATLPTTNEFDFVMFSQVGNFAQLELTTRDQVTHINPTFQIDVYCLRPGNDITAKQNAHNAVIELASKVTEIMAYIGFAKNTQTPDLAFGGRNNISQIDMRFSRSIRTI